MSDELLPELTRRYGNVDASLVASIMAPALLEVIAIDPEVRRADGVPGTTAPWTARFQVEIPDGEQTFLTRGRTGKFVPSDYVEGDAPWREIAKGRILSTPAPGDRET